jgi:thiamine-monophosphate kinase
MNEFELIARYFTRKPSGAWATAGVGDDCALVDLGDRTLAVTTDLLVEHRHFFSDVDPESLGHKALAVNLSDLAAAGAAPRCFFLALALPRADETWLAGFSAGLFRLAETFGCDLIGGDTTRAPRIDTRDGPIAICITALGEVPRGAGLTRAGARPGDDVWVSGTLGDAALALAHMRSEVQLDRADAQFCRERLERPQPRVALGQALRGIATACIDVSDGLLGDLGHILERSGVGAQVSLAQLPLSPALRRQANALQRRCALAGGDDYELLFAAPVEARAAAAAAAQRAGVAVARIGTLTQAGGPELLDESGQPVETSLRSFDHFAS